MQITAALVPEKGAPFRLETLHLVDPGPDEVVVRVAACGVCQTDVHGRDDYFGIPFPCVFGHEGAGVVERIGARVTKLATCERGVMASPSCRQCSAYDVRRFFFRPAPITGLMTVAARCCFTNLPMSRVTTAFGRRSLLLRARFTGSIPASGGLHAACARNESLRVMTACCRPA